MRELLLDFNHIDAVTGFHAAYEPTQDVVIGDLVEAFDPDGNRCFAVVRGIECGRILIELKTDTWHEGP